MPGCEILLLSPSPSPGNEARVISRLYPGRDPDFECLRRRPTANYTGGGDGIQSSGESRSVNRATTTRQEVERDEGGGGDGGERIRFRWQSGGQCKTVKLWKRGGTQCRLIDETKGFEGVGKASGCSLVARKGARKRERAAVMDGERSRERERVERGEEKGRRRNGTGECSLEPITVARPGVRQTLYSFSNNANKRASILRFYRAVLSVFDNRPSGQRRSRHPQSGVARGVQPTSTKSTEPAFVPVIHPVQGAECAMFLRFGVQAFPDTNSFRDCPFRFRSRNAGRARFHGG